MRSAATATHWVYAFEEGDRTMRDRLGGKGANLAEMTRVLGPERVPAGFTIATDACIAYLEAGGRGPEELPAQVAAALDRLEARTGRRLGDADDPLLVSVRSGARVSMPGMLDTVLNLGLDDAAVEGLATRSGDERFAWDAYRRFVQMFGQVVLGVPGHAHEVALLRARRDCGATTDGELPVPALRRLVDQFKRDALLRSGTAFPDSPLVQLDMAIRAVFDSWSSERAVTYRRIHGIPDEWGTAVNVQQMVFGNRGERSATGVAFSRHEITGAPEPSGDFLLNAQGEDVVSGVRNTNDLSTLRDVMPAAHAELLEILRQLERHYGDMQDTEFTIEEGRLFLLQTRNAKRPAQAAVRFACDAVDEGLLSSREALATIDARSLETLLHPTFDPASHYTPLARGVGASPGAAKGAIVFEAADAVAAAAEGRDVILARPFTEADDVAGFHAAGGIVTSEGGKASHAALVARGMGRPAVTGVAALEIDVERRTARCGGVTLAEGEIIAIDGSAGTVTLDDVPLISAPPSPYLERVLGWADEHRALGVRANADTPEDARRARRLGADGIGLCRTEHMFLGDRQPLMASAILAADAAERREPLERLRALQEQDFAAIFAVMRGRPVTIRLLDPPLHEFLPRPEELPVGVVRDRIANLQEANPMLGMRGVRLGILFPEIYAMQLRAIFTAFQETSPRPQLEILVPLVAYESELKVARRAIETIAGEFGLAAGEDFLVGTMIELPRACLLAERIAAFADFFSFGTNDLTQTALGFSRDDIERRVLAAYLEDKLVDHSPFETIDAPGVGQLVRMGAWLGRKTNRGLKLGVCGEHGGDPESIRFFAQSGIDYVSCSPFRVPVARLAAAQAAIAD